MGKRGWCGFCFNRVPFSIRAPESLDVFSLRDLYDAANDALVRVIILTRDAVNDHIQVSYYVCVFVGDTRATNHSPQIALAHSLARTPCLTALLAILLCLPLAAAVRALPRPGRHVRDLPVRRSHFRL